MTKGEEAIFTHLHALHAGQMHAEKQGKGYAIVLVAGEYTARIPATKQEVADYGIAVPDTTSMRFKTGANSPQG
jgi:hypothetical protein